MNVDISVDDASLGKAVQDISSARGGHIVALGDNDDSPDGSSGTTIDLKKIYAPRDPWESESSSTSAAEKMQSINIQRQVRAKVPLKEMVGYLKHLRSMTGGRGTFVMSVDRFERMSGQREKVVVQGLRGG